jgi:hypothetical protein
MSEIMHPIVALLLASIGLIGLWLVAWGIWSAVRRRVSTMEWRVTVTDEERY